MTKPGADEDAAARPRDHLRLLILNGDLPVFPGWGGVEYLHTTRMAGLARRVGLVSLVHTREQHEKAGSLTDSGVALSPLAESQPWPSIARSRGGRARRHGCSHIGQGRATSLVRNGARRPADTLIQDLQFRNLSAPFWTRWETKPGTR